VDHSRRRFSDKHGAGAGNDNDPGTSGKCPFEGYAGVSFDTNPEGLRSTLCNERVDGFAEIVVHQRASRSGQTEHDSVDIVESAVGIPAALRDQIEDMVPGHLNTDDIGV
jgi:hypothetical protein